jgi:hypothetical protein
MDKGYYVMKNEQYRWKLNKIYEKSEDYGCSKSIEPQPLQIIG